MHMHDQLWVMDFWHTVVQPKPTFNYLKFISRELSESFFPTKVSYPEKPKRKASHFGCVWPLCFEMFEVFLKQMKIRSPFGFLQKVNQNTTFFTWFNQKVFCQQLIAELLRNANRLKTLTKSFNWLNNFDLHLKKLEKLHAIDGRVLMNRAANYMSINFKP